MMSRLNLFLFYFFLQNYGAVRMYGAGFLRLWKIWKVIETENFYVKFQVMENITFPLLIENAMELLIIFTCQL